MCISASDLADYVEPIRFMREIPECNAFLMEAYKYHALPNRQHLISNEKTRSRNKETLLAIGESNMFYLNSIDQEWQSLCNSPLEENYRRFFFFIFITSFHIL